MGWRSGRERDGGWIEGYCLIWRLTFPTHSNLTGEGIKDMMVAQGEVLPYLASIFPRFLISQAAHFIECRVPIAQMPIIFSIINIHAIAMLDTESPSTPPSPLGSPPAAHQQC